MTTPVYAYIYSQSFISVNNNLAQALKKSRLMRPGLLIGLALLAAGLTTGCFSGKAGQRQGSAKYPLSGKSYVINGQRYHILASAHGYCERGQASWYGEPFHGRKTANGEIYDMHRISAAHTTLPLDTWVEIYNLDNKKKMCVRINDRGPFIKGRIIDLSLAAAKELGVYRPGLASVMVTAVTDPAKISALKAAENRPPASPPPTRTVAAAAKPPASKTAAAAKPKAGGPPAQTASRPAAEGSAPGNAYLVYVAKTPDPDQAQILADKISQTFESVKIRVSYEGGRPYFQVRVEGFNGFNQAKAAQTRLARLGYVEASVISN